MKITPMWVTFISFETLTHTHTHARTHARTHSIQDDPYPGKPATARNQKTSDLVIADRRLTIRHVATTLGISYESKSCSRFDLAMLRTLAIRVSKVRLTPSGKCDSPSEGHPVMSLIL